MARTDPSRLDISAEVTLNWRGDALYGALRNAAHDFANVIGLEIVVAAQRRTEPGKGPGPHPHRWKGAYTDTGDLQRSIMYRLSRRRGESRVMVFSDTDQTGGVPYGMYLELGFHERISGENRLYRYPWLAPSVVEVAEGRRKLFRKATQLVARNYGTQGRVVRTKKINIFGRKINVLDAIQRGMLVTLDAPGADDD